jgi:hypothetical protein
MARTGVLPPQVVRMARRVPRSRCKGATPTRAASRWRLNVPTSGQSSRSGRAQTGPILRTRRSRPSRSHPTGLPRSVVSRSSSRAASRVLSPVIGPGCPAGAARAHSRGGAVPRYAWRPMAAAAPTVHDAGRPGGQAEAGASGGWPQHHKRRRPQVLLHPTAQRVGRHRSAGPQPVSASGIRLRRSGSTST